MRPRDMPSGWVKVCPWYYTGRRTPARKTAKRKAIEADRKASGR